jgi:hypothetical protein
LSTEYYAFNIRSHRDTFSGTILGAHCTDHRAVSGAINGAFCRTHGRAFSRARATSNIGPISRAYSIANVGFAFS